MKVILLGPPGAGKGTLASILKDELNLIHISTGDLLRDEMKNNTELGLQVRKFVENGELVPDEVVTQMVDNKLGEEGVLAKGFMLDGFPRTRTQAQDLDKIMEKLDSKIDHVLYMAASLSVVVKRLSGRRVCKKCGALFHVVTKPSKQTDICDECGCELYQRPDDHEQTINNRMDVYMRTITPLLNYYKAQDKLEKVDADKGAVEIKLEVMKILNGEEESDQSQG